MQTFLMSFCLCWRLELTLINSPLNTQCLCQQTLHDSGVSDLPAVSSGTTIEDKFKHGGNLEEVFVMFPGGGGICLCSWFGDMALKFNNA